MKNGQMLLLVPELPCDSNSKITIAAVAMLWCAQDWPEMLEEAKNVL